MATHESFLIVGGGLAAAKAAQTLRDEVFSGGVTILAGEPRLPYERPPLSKGYLAGSDELDAAYVHDAAWYADAGITVRTGTRATAVDPGKHTVTLDGAEGLRYDRLLLATGSSARTLDVPGSQLASLHYLREMPDAQRLREDLAVGGRRVVVVGGGWIGLEVAAAARGYGNPVTVVEPQPAVLRTAIGDELGGVFADLHREHGVELRLGTSVTGFDNDGERVTAVRVRRVGTDGSDGSDGSDESIGADIVVIGVGAQPNTRVAQAAGLTVDNGIIVDETLTSSDPDIFAAGDVANAYHPLLRRHLRVEHWANALNMGPAAARSMVGQLVSYDRVPYFYTDQYDLGMEYSGHVEGPQGKGFDQIVYRGDRDAREFIAFWLSGGRVLAGMNVNVWDVTDPIQAMIRSGAPVDPARLADPTVPLEDLLPQHAASSSLPG